MDEIYQAPLYKRILAPLADGILTTLLAIGIFMLLVNGAIDIGFHNLDLKLAQYRLQEDSLLFDIQKDGNGNYSSISLLSYDEQNKEEPKRFVKILHTYYVNYVDDANKSEASFNKKYMLFDEKTLQNPIFSITSIDQDFASYTLLDEVTDVSTKKTVSKDNEQAYYQAIAHFFMDEQKGVYHLAMSEFTSSARFQDISSKLSAAERLEVLICISFASLVYLCLPILINKHGQTPFMHLLGICFVDSFGYQVKWRHKIIRAATTLLIYASSSYLFGVPIVINAITMFVNSQKRSVLDYASNEVVIDKKTSVILTE